MDPGFSLSNELLDDFKAGNDLLDTDTLAEFLNFPEPHLGDEGAFSHSHGAVMMDPSPPAALSSICYTVPSAPAKADPPCFSAVESGDRSEHIAANNVESSGARKRRQRDAGQMELNRISQQKYRERKKAEHQELHNAVEMLTAQLAALKAIEARASEVEVENATLREQLASQAATIKELQAKVKEQGAALAAKDAHVAEQERMASHQQKMILEQHTKIRLQEEIISRPREHISTGMDEVWGRLKLQDNAEVCKRMHEAVSAALLDATHMEGLQVALQAIPDIYVVEICKNILHACRDMWPHIFTQLPCIQGPQAICASAFPAPVPQQCM